ncbi:MAG: T9SS type A sorting domain-containing protein [Bacteroidales bacterium]|nr:T9SS type A sorting domain-containing protein [Bacteroidales bacterium]
MKKFKTLFVIISILNTSFIFAQFPQQKVNKCYYQQLNNLRSNKIINKHWHNKSNLDIKQCINHSKIPFDLNHPYINISRYNFFTKELDLKNININKRTKSNDLYVGYNDSVLIVSDTIINGDIIIYGNGVFIVDSAKLTLSGNLYARDNGQAIFRNYAHLHFNQLYMAQYFLFLVNNAKFEATDVTIDGNNYPLNFQELRDSSVYIARRVNFIDWVFRKVYNNSTLILEDVDFVGDLLVDDSCQVNFTRCAKLLPWLEAPYGSVFDIQFPMSDTVLHFEFNETQPGIDGIGYTMTIDTCNIVWWGIESFPGSNLTVTNSLVYGAALRISGSDTLTFYGVLDSTYYTDFTVPLPDRHFQLLNSAVYSWQPYALENTVLYIDSCSFGEMMGKNNSVSYITNSVCDGIWQHLGFTDNAFGNFTDGLVKSFVSVWQNATLLIVNSSVKAISPWAPPPLGPNIAHNHSYLLAVNSEFDFLPEAQDTSLVMFVALDTLDITQVDNNINISGSAWIDAGPDNSPMITFDRYKLYYCLQPENTWTLIEESTSQVYQNLLSVWNTNGLNQGDYLVKLTIWDNEGDSLSALRPITLIDTLTNINTINNYSDIIIYPNPTTGVFTINFAKVSNFGKVEAEITNISGQVLHYSSDDFKSSDEYRVDLGNQPKGVYFVKIITENGTAIKKIVLE